jgi:hypothetical protein
MKTKKNQQELKGQEIFLVMVPHQDVRIELREFNEDLIKNGLKGVYPFPYAAPLAVLSSPLDTDELKLISRSLRNTAGDEKFYLGEHRITSIDTIKEASLCGPCLNIKIPVDIFNFTPKINKIISPIVIGVNLLPKNNEQQLFKIIDSAPLREKLSFRAAAVASMFWQPVQIDGEAGYKWEIGKLHWLPKK